MNYKSACDHFRSRYNRENLRTNAGMPKMSDVEILMEMSVIQKELCETYRLSQKYQTLNLVSNQYKYVVGTLSTNIKADILDIDNIIGASQAYTLGGYGTNYGYNYGGGGTVSPSGQTLNYEYPLFLQKASIGDIGNYPRISGFPTRYAFHDDDDLSVLWLDSLPATYSASNGYQLIIFYNQKMYLFYDTPTNNNTTWSDYDPDSATYGGSFKLPNQFHSLIIEGALASSFPKMFPQYWAKVQEMVKHKPKSVSGQLQYSLG